MTYTLILTFFTILTKLIPCVIFFQLFCECVFFPHHTGSTGGSDCLPGLLCALHCDCQPGALWHGILATLPCCKLSLYTTLYNSTLIIQSSINQLWGANFMKRLKLNQLSLCIRFEPQNRLKSVREIGPCIIQTCLLPPTRYFTA